MKIACLGDSITFGYGVPRSKSWAALSSAESGFTLVNAGINGDTTGGMLARLDRDVLQAEPDIVMLLGGTNDLLANAPVGAIQANVMAIIQQARHRGCRTMLGTPPPIHPTGLPAAWKAMYAHGAQADAFAAYQSWLPVFAEAFDVVLVDFFSALNAAGALDGCLLDGVHPNAFGHRIMADRFLLCLRALV